MFWRKKRTPEGVAYKLYVSMLDQPHLLIAGATGSGKSVAINGIISTALYSAPAEKSLVLIDPKRVELAKYRRTPHCIRYASEPAAIIQALADTVETMEKRYARMQRQGLRDWQGGHIYVVIDELADLMLTQRKAAAPLIQRLCQLGRAAKIHVIAATQCPIRDVIPTPIKANLDARLGLRTRSAQDSRNILGVTGCETLPRYGQGYYMTPEGMQLYNVPMVADSETDKLIRHWR